MPNMRYIGQEKILSIGFTANIIYHFPPYSKKKRAKCSFQTVEKVARPQKFIYFCVWCLFLSLTFIKMCHFFKKRFTSCFCRFQALPYHRTPTSLKSTNLPSFFGICGACRRFIDTLKRAKCSFFILQKFLGIPASYRSKAHQVEREFPQIRAHNMRAHTADRKGQDFRRQYKIPGFAEFSA